MLPGPSSLAPSTEQEKEKEKSIINKDDAV